jgi:PRC-barrel domain protein
MRKVIVLMGAVGLLLSAAPGFAQQAPAAQPAGAATKASPQPQASETQALVGLPVYSSDDQKVGQVKSVDAGSDGTMTLEAEIEGFLGLGTSSVRLTSDQFQHKGDRVVLSKTAGEVRGVPEESYKSFDRRDSGPEGAP